MLFNECKYFTTYSLNNALRYRLGDVLIVHFNIRSLQKNIDKMSQYLSELEKQPEIIALTETKLKENYIRGNIELPGYKFIHVNSSTLAGGVRFYIKEKIKFSILEEFSINVDAVENMWIRTYTKKKKPSVLGVVYRHPVSTVEHINLFSAQLTNTFHKLNLQKLEYYAVGDFNIDLLQLEQKHHVRMYADSLIGCSVKCTINKPTRITSCNKYLSGNKQQVFIWYNSQRRFIRSSWYFHYCTYKKIRYHPQGTHVNSRHV